MRLGLPWFGPKTGFGWGWTPVTWQGWAITALFLILFLGACYAPVRHKGVVCGVLLVGYLAIVVATGTKPGGRLL